MLSLSKINRIAQLVCFDYCSAPLDLLAHKVLFLQNACPNLDRLLLWEDLRHRQVDLIFAITVFISLFLELVFFTAHDNQILVVFVLLENCLDFSNLILRGLGSELELRKRTLALRDLWKNHIALSDRGLCLLILFSFPFFARSNTNLK